MLQGNFATEIAALVTDLTTADKVNINEAIFQETFWIDGFVGRHTLRTGVRNGSVISIIGAMDNYCSMPVGDERSCELNECDITPNYIGKKWDLAEYNCRIAICMRTFDEDFLVFWNMYRQRLEDPLQEADAQAFLNYITDQVERNVMGTQWRVGYWGDKASGSNLINGNNGFFAQASAGGGFIDQIASVGPEPTGQEIIDAVQAALEENSDTLWLAHEDVVIKMSYAMANKVVIYLNRLGMQNQYNCDCVNPDGIVSANRFTVEGLRLFGIPVEAHREIDGGAACAGVNGNKYQLLIARKSNLLVGTNTVDKMEGFDIFYDKKDRQIYIDTMIYLGVSIPLDEYIYLSTEAGS